MSTQAIPALLYRTRTYHRSLDRWGLGVSLAVIISALSGVIFGVDAAGILIVAVALPAAVYGLRDPGVGLIGIGVLVTAQAFLQATSFSGSSPLPFNTLNYWLIVFCLLHAKRILHIHHLQSKLHLLLVAVLAAGLFGPQSPFRGGLVDVLSLCGGFGVILYFEVLPAYQRRMLFWAAVSASVVACIVGYLQYRDATVASEFNPNGMGAIQVTALFTIFLAVFAKVIRRREMNALLLLGAVNLAYAFLSGSRGAISTALFLWLGILVWGVSLSRKVAYTAATIVVALGVGSLSPQFQDYALQRLDRTFDSSISVSSRSSGRSDIAMIGWKLFSENPMGIGTGAFREASAGFYDRDLDRFYPRGKAAHSAWVKVLAENGVIGALVLMVYVASFTWTGFLKRGYPGLFPAGLIISGAIAIRFLAVELGQLGAWWLVGGGIFLFYKLPRPARIPRAMRRIRYQEPFRPHAQPAGVLQK